MSSLIIREFQGKSIRQRKDGYLSLTDMAQAKGKRYSDWARLDSTKILIQKVAEKYQIPLDQVIISCKGGIPENQGTWALEEVALVFHNWCLRSFSIKQTEKSVQKRLQRKLGGDIEVMVPSGSIDLLTITEIIEIKKASKWKEGVGQLMIYGQDYPSHTKRLHIFGKTSGSFQRMVERYCKPLNIKDTYEE